MSTEIYDYWPKYEDGTTGPACPSYDLALTAIRANKETNGVTGFVLALPAVADDEPGSQLDPGTAPAVPDWWAKGYLVMHEGTVFNRKGTPARSGSAVEPMSLTQSLRLARRMESEYGGTATLLPVWRS